MLLHRLLNYDTENQLGTIYHFLLIFVVKWTIRSIHCVDVACGGHYYWLCAVCDVTI